MQNNAESAGKAKKARGSVRNVDRLQAFASGGESGDADWGACTPERVQAVVHGITKLGGAVTFGLSRDKGAHSLTLMLDDMRRTLWFNGAANLDDELDVVVGTLSQMS